MSWKGMKKMKKKYLGFGLIYGVIALLIFSVSISIFTESKIDQLNYGFRNCMTIPDSILGVITIKDRDKVVSRVIYTWELLSYLEDDVGIYSTVVDTRNGGRVIFESQPFLEARYYGEIETEVIENSEFRYEEKSTQLVPGDIRYMFLEDKGKFSKDEVLALMLPRTHEVSIKGARCDETFLYGGTLTFTCDDTVRTLNISEPEVVNERGSVTYEEWLVRLDEVNYYDLGGRAGMNNKAHKLSDKYVDMLLDGKATAGTKVREGIFTSTASAVYDFDSGNYLITYYMVINPLQIVLRDNLKIYILSVLALILVEAAIVFVVRKLYINQKKFELRSEKLTKGIAYDLQGPLSVTRKYLDNWENIDDDKRSEYSEKIISEVDHMSSMVTRLLELSKLQDGKVKLNCEDVDLLQLTQNIIKRNRQLISDKKIDVTFAYDKNEEAYPVYADLEMIYIVINNFVTNAIKYCDETITIRLEKRRNTVEFSITNDGARIEKTDFGKVWDILYKPNKGMAEPDGNSGVGLSVVKDILDAHNARYGCYSGSKGTNFWFFIDAYDDRSFS